MAGSWAPSTYVDEYQEQMLEAFRKDSYFGLLDVISRAEQHKSPSPGISRIADDVTTDWRNTGAFLLCQPLKSFIEATLMNQLPRRAQNDLKSAVRDPSAASPMSVTAGDPLVYINWLADKDGNGLSVQEYGEFLDAIEVAARLLPDTQPLARRSTSLSIQNGIEVEFRELSGGKQTLVTRDKVPGLQDNARQFINENRNVVIPRAIRKGNTEIMVRAEVGWSSTGKQRANQHKKLTSSPLLFRVANCLLRFLFPSRGFKMHQFVCFDIVQADDAAVGEAIASHLGASYIGYGGFNFDQAGKNVGDVYSSNINWHKVNAQAIQYGHFSAFESNAEDFTDHLKAKQKEIQQSLEWHRNHVDFVGASHELSTKLQALEDSHHRLLTASLQTRQKLQQLRRDREEREQSLASRRNDVSALRRFANGLGLALEDE